MKNKMFKVLLAVMTVGTLVAGCGSSSEPADGGKESSGEKKTFTIYNAAGAPDYHEKVVLAKFKEEFGDKYDIQYETIGGADVVAKIEAQGLEKGKGNVNIVMAGDSHIVMGLESGIWADLSGEEEALRISELTDMGTEIWESYDTSAVPISVEPSQACITYMPGTEKGQIIDSVVGEDQAISFDEITKLLADNPEMKMGRGRYPGSGPGDIFTLSMIQEFDAYNEDVVPQNSIDKWKDAYTNGQVNLYEGTGDTFKDLTAGNVDMTPHSLSWFYRLYSLKLEEATLPEELKVDSLGLENAKFARIVDSEGQELPAILNNHCYLIPANLSDEDYEASMEFMKWVTSPEMNAEVLTVLAAPAYKDATPDLVTDENIQLVWDAVQKYYPAQYLEEINGVNTIKTSDREYLMPVTDVGITNTYKTAWQEQLESQVK